jgi:hypothetical protein
MTILDTFFLLFEADATELDDALGKTRKKGKETADELSHVDAVARRLGHTLGDQLKQLGGALLGALAVRAMADNMMAATEHADKLNLSAERLGQNIEHLSAWGDLVKKNGGSLEGFTGGIEAFNKQLVQMEATGKSRAAPFLKELGIDLEDAAHKGKTAMDFLPEIADAVQGMNREKAQALGARLGLDAATIMTLQAGRREVEALLAKERELGVVTKEQGEIADKFGDTLDDTRHAFRSLWTEVATAVLPALTWVLEKFQGLALWMRKHSDFIVGLMIALGTAVMVFLVPPLLKAGAAAIVAFAPFLVLGAIVAALAVAFALLYDDVQAFMAGNDSLIGQILQKWPVVGDMAKAIVGWLRFLWDVAAALLQFLVTMWDSPSEAWDAFVTNIVDGIERRLSMFPALGETVGGVAEAIGAAFDALVSGVTSAIEAVLGAANRIATAFPGLASLLNFSPSGAAAAGLAAGKALLGDVGASPVGAVSSTAIANTTRGGDRSVKVDKVEVHTQATDAQGISRSIGGALGSQLRQANSQFDDGVAA